jgi:hypothetical protein
MINPGDNGRKPGGRRIRYEARIIIAPAEDLVGPAAEGGRHEHGAADHQERQHVPVRRPEVHAFRFRGFQQ